ncbi:MAG TPA: DsbA family oxidoreductase [Candidatus Limnocylindrales bacterium]|jgi:predicted DsbA family dithiol-disulfide isomerase|nr:DsbA family oxidoreductase [Candidatus Limnocylindrales bacterium]
MKVEIWSDVVCPWCYIGKRRLERALAEFEAADEVEITWRSFQLNPDYPVGTREAHDEHLARKLGATIDQVHQLNERVVALAAAEGLDYHFDTYVTVNTFDAHRVTHLAKAMGLGLPIHERFLRAQLVEGEVLDDPDTLVRLAAEVGVPEAETRRVLDTDAFAAEVRADIEEARALGITGVPFFVIDRRYGISGAQPAALFLEALRTAHHDAAEAAAG